MPTGCTRQLLPRLLVLLSFRCEDIYTLLQLFVTWLRQKRGDEIDAGSPLHIPQRKLVFEVQLSITWIHTKSTHTDWTDVIGVDSFLTDFTRTLRMYQDWAIPLN